MLTSVEKALPVEPGKVQIILGMFWFLAPSAAPLESGAFYGVEDDEMETAMGVEVHIITAPCTFGHVFLSCKGTLGSSLCFMKFWFIKMRTQNLHEKINQLLTMLVDPMMCQVPNLNSRCFRCLNILRFCIIFRHFLALKVHCTSLLYFFESINCFEMHCYVDCFCLGM